MADWAPINVAPGVVKRESFWGHYFEGSKEALVAAGVAREEWFPDGKGRNRRGKVIRTLCFEHEGRRVECRKPKSGRCYLSFTYSGEERQRHEERIKFERALSGAKTRIDNLPDSYDDYRTRAAHHGPQSIDGFLTAYCRDGYGGYRFAPEVIEAVQDKLEEIAEILSTGRVLFSEDRRREVISEIRAETAASDPGLRKLLDGLTTARQER